MMASNQLKEDKWRISKAEKDYAEILPASMLTVMTLYSDNDDKNKSKQNNSPSIKIEKL